MSELTLKILISLSIVKKILSLTMFVWEWKALGYTFRQNRLFSVYFLAFFFPFWYISNLKYHCGGVLCTYDLFYYETVHHFLFVQYVQYRAKDI